MKPIIETLQSPFYNTQYLFRRKLFSIFGGDIEICNNSGELVLYSYREKAYSYSQDFHIYTDERKIREVLTIIVPKKCREGWLFHVKDAAKDMNIGAIKIGSRPQFTIQEDWVFISRDGQEIGKLIESTVTRGLLHRLIRFLPQRYVAVSSTGKRVAEIRKHFNPLVLKYSLEVVENEPSIDPRLLISAVIITAVEAKVLISP